MDQKRILVLASEADRSIAPVIEKLKGRGAMVSVVFTERFPTSLGVDISINDRGGVTASLADSSTGEVIPMRDFHSVWYRHPGKPIPHAEITDARARAFVKEECNYTLEGLWKILENDSFWVSKPTSMKYCSYRLNQLAIARNLGFSVPDTLVSNNPSEIVDFFHEKSKNIITKAVGVGVPILDKEGYAYYEVVFTHRIEEREIDDFIETTRYAPHIYQECVHKDYELRVTVVGRKVFACAIHSQDHSDDGAKLDWRRVTPTEIKHEMVDIPERLADLCVRLVERLGLNYGAIDILRDKLGNYVFLEINSDGQYGWIEHLTGSRITDALVDLLLDHH
jgi:glutathione synthase/RimK-type ligase-like ATP-grasp enzyme